jgi:hypothetical protein
MADGAGEEEALRRIKALSVKWAKQLNKTTSTQNTN